MIHKDMYICVRVIIVYRALLKMRFWLLAFVVDISATFSFDLSNKGWKNKVVIWDFPFGFVETLQNGFFPCIFLSSVKNEVLISEFWTFSEQGSAIYAYQMNIV